MKTTKQYLIVDTKRYRRHSAPDNLSSWLVAPPRGRDDRFRASVSDFSVLLENQSESGSSLELDTSSLSRDLSPVPPPGTESKARSSYQNISLIDFETNPRSDDEYKRNLLSWPVWKNVILSQAIAGCMAVMDVSNATFKREPPLYPTNGQNLPYYILLGFLWTSKLVLRNEGRDIVQVIKYSGLRYFFLSVLHVEANYLLVASYHHDAYLGNQTIVCVAAVLSFVIAYVCLEVRFRPIHASGFAFAMLGSLGLSIAGATSFDQNEGDTLLGDVLRIGSGICLALNSIAQEIIIKSIDFVEYMGMVGLIGSFVCGLQAMTLETHRTVPQTTSYWLGVLSYSGAQFLYNSMIPKVLHEMGATGLHLALTASPFYSCFIQVLYHRYKWNFLYLISYGITLGGSIIFFIKRTIVGKETFFPIKIIIRKEN